MFHSDHGCQYLSAAFRHRLSRCGIVQSVSCCGNCLDNAPTERLFRSLKSEWIPKAGYRRLAQAKSDMFCYLFDYYHQRRPHSFNTDLPPAVAKQPKLVIKILDHYSLTLWLNKGFKQFGALFIIIH
ncbi:integrase core domain-containing protein [Gilliamella sp. Nev3-1]|uniref:integrase core domain-containing protein n=1 Tax=Gilliamella sp. Nev3-1 TaxID=3120250 RepID=UPI0009BD5993|nr:integrase core domain-containing protein [Gilliamella apicola]